MREDIARIGAAVRTSGVSDKELVAGTLHGEAAAFEGIMRRYNQRLFRLARSVVRDDAEAEDIVQETYVRAYVKLADLARPEDLGAWLGRIALNEAISRKRRQGRFKDPPGPGASAEDDWDRLLARIKASVPNPEERAAMREIRHLIEEAIDSLPETYGTVFMLRIVERMSTAETAAYLQISPQTVKTRLHRARQLLQAALSEQIDAASSDAFPFAGQRCNRTVETVLRRVGFVPPPSDSLH